MRTMFDDISAQNVPDTGDLYAGYDDGNWPDAAALQLRFPNKRVLRVTVSPADNEGDVLDVEKGDASPADLPGWLIRRRATGGGPYWAYTSQSQWQTCQAACAFFNVAQPLWWIANWDNDPTIPAGASAKQYQSTTLWDVSSMLDVIPGFDTVAVPPAINPPISLDAPLVDTHLTSLGIGFGQLFLTQTGAIYAYGSAKPVRGCNGEPWFAGRQAARFGSPTPAEAAAGKVIAVIATSGERYALPTP